MSSEDTKLDIDESGEPGEPAAADLTDADVDAETGATDGETDSDATDVTATDADVDDEVDDVVDIDDVADEEADAAPVRNRRWGRILAGVLAVLLIASAGSTAWLYFHTYRNDRAVGQAASDAVLQQAKDATIAVLSYSPDNLDKDLDAAKSHLTGDFLTYYTQFTDQVVRPAVKTKKVSTSANVVQAAVSEMQPDQAKVLVFVNQVTTSADRTEPSLTSSSVVVTMKKIDGRWLISAFDPV